jgi:hypothetical protein
LQTPSQLSSWKNEEEVLLKDMALTIVESGVNLVSIFSFFPRCANLTVSFKVITPGRIHPVILHWLNRNKVAAIEEATMNDIRQTCAATGAKPCFSAENLDPIGMISTTIVKLLAD